MRHLPLAFWIVVMLLYLPGQTQTTFVVEQVPANTPAGDTLYVAGTFNDWQPDHPAYRLPRRADGSYQLTIGELSPPFEYKFTRGSWKTGEADGLGKPNGNRRQESGEPPLTIAVHISGWEDQPGLAARDSLQLLVTRIPENTPEDASLFVTGTFNSWQPGDANYQLVPQANGTWTTAIPIYGDTTEYKFLRGSWTTVEGRKSGRARFNRVFIAQASPSVPLQLQIETWEDLSGTPINGYTVFWLIAAILGMLILVAINTIERPIPPANRFLSLLLLLFSLALVTRVVVYDREIFQWQPKLLLVPDLLYFLYAPIFVMYIEQLLRTAPLQWGWRRSLAFLPLLLQLIAYAPLLLLDHDTFINHTVDQQIRPYFEIAGGIGLIYNLAYWLYARRIIQAYQRESENEFSSGSNLTFLNTIMGLKAICLILWGATYVVGVYGRTGHQELTLVTDATTDAAWIGFSLTIFLLGYFALREPDIFRLPGTPTPKVPPPSPPTLPEVPIEEVVPLDQALFDRLTTVMEQAHPYLNPKLTLSELADLVDSPPHDLSRAINQGHKMNFNDFVNSYRVEAFKSKVLEPAFQNHTLLAVAFMVGFNSKTAFNRAFKKLSGQTPGEFFRSQGSKS